MSFFRSLFRFASLILILVATIFHITAYSTPAWTGSSSLHNGLWQACGIRCIKLGRSAVLDSVRAMESLALIAFVASCGLSIAYLVTKQNALRLGMAAAAIIGGILALVGVAIYGAEFPGGLYYSYGLCCVGAILSLGAGLCGLCAKDDSYEAVY